MIKSLSSLTLLVFFFFGSALQAQIPSPLPAPDGKPFAKDKPVKVYILSGQSNMVGIGQVDGGGQRWSGVTDASVSVYEGEYSADQDYDKLTPLATKELATYGGVKPTAFPGGGVQVSRGMIQLKKPGKYRFSPGYRDSTYNIMHLDGEEVYRKEVGGKPTHKVVQIEAGKKYAFKVTFLTKAATGLGWWHQAEIPGTLKTVAQSNEKFAYLTDKDGNFTERNDVWYRGLVTAGANKWLSIGCGAGNSSIGPELGFGHVMGYYHDQPVIVLKSSQGNRSLGWDFLPPGSEQFEFEGKVYAGYKDSPDSWVQGEPKKKVNWYAGKQYDDCFSEVHRVLKNFDSEFPQFKGLEYEIAGFAWWQGHKDGGSKAHAERYEQNLVHLIKTLRKEFDAPKAPFVIGTIGFDGWKMEGNQLTIANAQLAVSGEKGKYPEFAGNVKTVETRDFWIEADKSPRNQGFHYNGNAETYLNVGESLGRAMVDLVNQNSNGK